MATDPLVDLDSVPLDTVLVDRAGLDEYLSQRGTFAAAEGVLHEDVEGGIVVGYRDVRADDWWAADHIPGRPMFPGVMMIETAAQIASYDFAKHRTTPEKMAGRFIGFGGADRVRFRGLVEPPARMLFAIRLLKGGSRMFRYAAQGFLQKDGVVDDTIVFEAEIVGVLV